MVRERVLFIFYQLEYSFTWATNARNDGVSVISLTYSTCLEHKVSDLRTSDFYIYYANAISMVRERILFIFFQLEYSFFFIHMGNQCKE